MKNLKYILLFVTGFIFSQGGDFQYYEALRQIQIPDATPPEIPQTISNLDLWLDASDTATITHTTNFVTQWDDKSGNANHATQGNATDSPITNTRTVNSLNVLDFDGNNHWLDLPAALNSIPTGDNTVIVVVQSDIANRNERIINGDNGAGTRYALYKSGSTLRAINNSAFSEISHTTSATTGVNIYGLQRTGADLSIIYNGALETTIGVAADITLTGLNIGRFRVTDVQVFDGVICEILIYSKSLSSTELNTLGNYLETKWTSSWTDL